MPEFIHVPKTGGMSLTHSTGIAGDHKRVSEVVNADKKFLFAFVRNPFDRLWSAWNFSRLPGQVLNMESRSFKRFVLDLGTVPVPSLMFHPMSWFLDGPVGFIGRFEYLREDFLRLLTILELPGRELEHRHASNNGPAPYDDEMKSVVREFYAEDFARFGYGA